MTTQNKATSPNIKGPNYISICFFALVSLAMAGLQTWKHIQEYKIDTTPETFMWLVISGICSLSLLVLALWIVSRLIWKVVKLRRNRIQNESEIQYLQQELTTGLRELEIQQEMQQSFLDNGSSSQLLKLSAELLRAQNISFWRFIANDTRMECENALKSSKSAYDRDSQISQEQFPTLFRLLLAKETIIYPPTSNLAEEEEPQALGNLLHYIENNQIQALLILPIEVDGNVMGAAWFEHRELKREWSVRDQNQALFVSAIVRMQFYKNLQDGMIQELSEAVLQFDNFRNTANFGIGWFQLQPTLSLNGDAAELAEEIAEQALLEEANEQATHNLILDDSPFMGSKISLYLPEALLVQFVENNLQINNYEWERTHNGNREVLIISLYGIRIRGELAGIWMVCNDITTIKEKEWETSALLNNTSGILSLLDHENNIVFDSSSIIDIGYASGARLGTNLRNYLYPSDISLFDEAIERIQDPNHLDEELAQLRMQDAEGNWHSYQTHLKNLDSEPHAKGVLVEMHDIELQLQKMRVLDQEREFLAQLLKYGEELVMVLDEDRTIRYESENSMRLIGYATEERVGKYGLEYIHQTDTEALEIAFEKIKNGKITAHQQDIQFLPRNGQWRDMEFSMRKNQAGQIVARIKDVSKSKKASLLQANRESLLHTFLAASGNLYLLTNSKGKIKYISGNSEQVLGINTERLIGSFLGKLIPQNEKDAFARNLDVLVQDKQAQIQMYVHLPSASGELKHFLLRGHGHILEKAYTGLLLELEPINLEGSEDFNLALKANFFQSMANSFPNPLFFLDSQNHIKFANSATKELTVRAASGDFMDLLAADHREQAINWLTTRQPSIAELSFVGEGGESITHQARLFELKGSRIKGNLLHIIPKNQEEIKLLDDAYTQIDRLQLEVEELKQALANVEDDEALQGKLSAYRQQLAELMDEVASKDEVLKQQNQDLTAYVALLEGVNELQKPAKVLKQNYHDILEMVQKYQEITEDVQLTEKLEEIHNFSELINFEIVLKDAKSYIEHIKSTLEAVEIPKG